MDPYRYFRIEARELIDELSAGLTDLRRGETTAAVVGGLLRAAHTLKGAARVVAQTAIAEQTHVLEGLLDPFRATADPVPAGRVEEMVGQLNEIGDLLRALEAPLFAGAGSKLADGPEDPLGPRSGATASATGVSVPRIGTPPEVPLEASRQIPAEPVRTARASLAEIDAVIGGVGRSRTQLGLLRNGLAQAALRPAEAGLGDEVRDALDGLKRELATAVDRMERELHEVHDVAERLRLVPVTSIVSDLEGSARDVAAIQGKQVHVEVGGHALRLDAPVLAAVQGALRQIVRNAVAHGIEAPEVRLAAGKPAGGQVRLEISQNAGQVVFSCSDDGRGIDIDAVRTELGRGRSDRSDLDDQQVLELLALGGVSTATLSEVSGRGIGLDVVRDAAIQLGGQVVIRTRPGVGTTIDLTTPLSLSAQDVLLMDDGEVTAVRLSAILETARVQADDITVGLGGEVLRHAGRELPFLPLAAAFGDATRTARSQAAWSVLILAGRSGPVAIGVRRLIGTATIAIRPLPRLAPVAPLVSGIWLDVDTRARLVLDPEELSILAVGRRVNTVSAPTPLAPILIVDDSLTTRMLEQSVLESAGYRVELAASAEEGLALAARKPFALVLVDVEMPGMNGFEFVEQTRIRPELRHVPCILITSRVSAEDRQRGLAAGARAHIDKREFHQGALLERISELLGSRDGVDSRPTGSGPRG